MDKSLPPTLLVETWIQLARNNQSPDYPCSVIDKINTIFGSISEAELYLEMEKLDFHRELSNSQPGSNT